VFLAGIGISDHISHRTKLGVKHGESSDSRGVPQA